MLHLYQQVQPFLKCLQVQTQDPANRINTLTRVDLTDSTTQACQEFLKAPLLSPTSDWLLQLARASRLHLDQQVQAIIKWHQDEPNHPPI